MRPVVLLRAITGSPASPIGLVGKVPPSVNVAPPLMDRANPVNLLEPPELEPESLKPTTTVAPNAAIVVSCRIPREALDYYGELSDFRGRNVWFYKPFISNARVFQCRVFKQRLKTPSGCCDCRSFIDLTSDQNGQSRAKFHLPEWTPVFRLV